MLEKILLILFIMVSLVRCQKPFPVMPINFETHIEINIPTSLPFFGNITYNANEVYNFGNNRVKFEVNSQNDTFIDYYQLDNVN